jgi:hypothetical protein
MKKCFYIIHFVSAVGFYGNQVPMNFKYTQIFYFFTLAQFPLQSAHTFPSFRHNHFSFNFFFFFFTILIACYDDSTQFSIEKIFFCLIPPSTHIHFTFCDVFSVSSNIYTIFFSIQLLLIRN